MRWLARMVTRLTGGTKRKAVHGFSSAGADEEFLGYEALSSENFPQGTGTAGGKCPPSAKTDADRKAMPMLKVL